MTPPGVLDHAVHTPYSEPGTHAGRIADVSTDPAELGAVARNVIVHYRASGHELPAATRHEIDSRWMDRILAADQQRHPWPLAEPREVTDRVQGCCRDHTLFCVSVLRAHDIPARSRVGFAGYFTPGWHHDHVVVEAWLAGRWQSFDAEVDDAVAGAAHPARHDAARPRRHRLRDGGTRLVGLPRRRPRPRDLRRRSERPRPARPALPVRRGDLRDRPPLRRRAVAVGRLGPHHRTGRRGHRGGRRVARRGRRAPARRRRRRPRRRGPARCRATGPTPASTPGRRSCRRRRSATHRSRSRSREADRS